jgi:hypothetical protein
MTSQTKLRFLVGLGVVLAAVLFFNMQSDGPAAPGSAVEETYKPMAVENPALHLDRIERLRKLEYHPTGRDIFSSELPPPPKPKEVSRGPVGPPPPPPEPALVVPFKYYGYSTDARTGKRRGLFTTGEDVIIASEGDTVQSRFRIVTIGTTSADVEEISTKRKATLTMEAPAGGPSPG